MCIRDSFDTALEKSGKGAEDFNRDVLLYRADAEFLLKDYNAAIHTYDLLLEMKPDTPEYMYRQSSCYAPVSYTHLDVYKRQDQDQPDEEIRNLLTACCDSLTDVIGLLENGSLSLKQP